MWCDDRGFLIEDGVVMRLSDTEYWVTSAEPNLVHLRRLVGRHRVMIEDVSDEYGMLAVQGPASRAILATLDGSIGAIGPFAVTPAKIGPTSVLVSRTGYSGDLGYEVITEAQDALAVWDAVSEAGAGRGLLPFGGLVLAMTRLEAGLLLIDVDYESSRRAWTDEQRATPIELGYRWMLHDLAGDDRAFVGRKALERELREESSRWRLVGLEVDWRDHEEAHRHQGIPPSKNHVPIEEPMMIYERDGGIVGHASSYMYSPVLQRHIAMARVPLALAHTGAAVRIEIPIHYRNHLVHARVTSLPFYDPPQRTARFGREP